MELMASDLYATRSTDNTWIWSHCHHLTLKGLHSQTGLTHWRMAVLGEFVVTNTSIRDVAIVTFFALVL